LSIIAEYSLLLFVWNFHNDTSIRFVKRTRYALGGFAAVILFYVCSGTIIASMVFDTSAKLYREVYGPLYAVNIVLALGFLPMFAFASWKRISEQNALNRIRLKRIAVSVVILIGALAFLQIVLPLFGIWILEKEIVVLFVAFVLSIVYITKRYYFS